MELIAGVDEAGRGPLSGPVFAAAVILDPHQPITGLMDSKKLSAKKHESLYEIICQKAMCYAIASASVEEIDRLNILQAALLAMQRAINQLRIKPARVLVDGNQTPKVDMACEAIIKGDQTIEMISAASIVAKVARDRVCLEHDALYPGYGFAKHKGYGTKQHLLALETLGPCKIHRKSFSPVNRLMKKRGFYIFDACATE